MEQDSRVNIGRLRCRQSQQRFCEMTICSRAILLWFALLPILGCQEHQFNMGPGSKPNIILIVVDALRADHLGVYGYPRPTSPFIDKLGVTGIVFENAYAQGNQTQKSTTSLFTGNNFPLVIRRPSHPSDKKAQPNPPKLVQENVLIQEVLRSEGYSTVGVFTNPHHHAESGFWQGFDNAIYLEPQETTVKSDRKRAYAPAATVVSEFLDWIEKQEEMAPAPFFAYLHFMDTHFPYEPPSDVASEFIRGQGKVFYANGVPRDVEQITDADVRYMIDLYDAEIRYLDTVLKGLFAEIGARNLTENTITFIASDHGDEFMEHGGFGHGRTLEREMLSVPLIVSGIGECSGTRIAPLVRNIDIFPTILDLTGAQTKTAIDGRSLLRLVLPDKNREEDEPRDSIASVGHLWSLTTSKWHYIELRKSDERTLYNILDDPNWTTNVADRFPDTVAAMSERIAAYAEEGRRVAQLRRDLGRKAFADDEPAAELDEKILDQMRALGYIE